MLYDNTALALKKPLCHKGKKSLSCNEWPLAKKEKKGVMKEDEEVDCNLTLR
jgi:hypothetical protein